MRPLIVFTISNGWGVRNFSQTGLLNIVMEKADVAIACTSDLNRYFLAKGCSEKYCQVLPLPDDDSGFWILLRRLKKFSLQSRHQISTAKIKSQSGTKNAMLRILKLFGWRISKYFSYYWQVKFIEMLENSFKKKLKLDLVRRPNLVVVCEPFDNRDISLQRTLMLEGVKSVAIIPSWDNPSTKGCFLTKTDSIFAWGDHQKNELLRFYPDITPEKIMVTGIPQFDAYRSDIQKVMNREEFSKFFGIPSDKKIILYATCSESLFADEHTIVEGIASAVADGRYGENVHLLVRCHPADRGARYKFLDDNNSVTVFSPSREEDKNLFNWIPPKDELDLLSASLRHSCLCINTASTMTLDAIACCKPVINIGFEPSRREYRRSVVRYYDYFHFNPIKESGAVAVVYSFEELHTEIEKAMANEFLYSEARTEVMKRFCYLPKEGSIKYIAKKILELSGK